MSDENELGIAPEGQTADTTKTAAEDPYFVRDGKAYTGEGDPIELDAAAKDDSDPEKPADDPKKQEKAGKKPRPSIGDAWNEVKAAKKETRLDREAARADREAAQAELAELKAERQLLNTDFRGFLKQKGMSLRDLLEADLKETDATPEERERKAMAGTVDEVRSELAQVKAELAAAREEKLAAQDMETLKSVATERAEDYPLLAARIEKLAPEIRNAYYAHEQKTGKAPPLDELFQAYENYLTDLGVQAPPKQPATSRPGIKRPGSAQRKGATLAESAEEEPDDEGNDAPSGGPANLTNRMASQRVSNGKRPITREERLAQATALLGGD